MITAQTTINIHLFKMPIQLKATTAAATIFEAYSDFGNGSFAPDLDKAIAAICKQLGVENFLETEVKIDAVFARYNMTNQRLYVEGIINLPNAKASLILNFQPSEKLEAIQDFALILDLNFAFDLADLPIIPKNELDEKLRLTLAFANHNGEFETIRFDENEIANSATETYPKVRQISVQSGIQLQPNIQLPKNNFSFNYELTDFSEAEKEAINLRENITNLPQLPKTKGTKWFELNQSFGGLNLNKIGVQWKNAKATVLLNLAYLSNGLELSILGLKASTALSLKAFKPKFDLHGIGVYYKNDFVELGGSLLRNDKTPQAYIGKMSLRLGRINIGAIGGFSKTETGENSFFAFANVALPIGGVPAFFITGIAAGFGHHSSLNLPKPAEVTNFPLLNIIKTGEQKPSAALAALGDFVTTKSGKKWLAAGVNFTSFQLVKGQLILAYEFAKKQVSILGIARLILPTEKAAYLNLQFGLKSIYKIQAGEIQSNTQLQNGSYLIHKGVNLTGSIAIYTWLKGENAGDFVLTIGGYHPKYQKPTHFPEVPKVGFNWQVSETTKMEGSVYFALTNQAIMTGFNFDATYEKGRLKAYFVASANMILQWKPFYYDFQTKIRLGATYQSRFLKNYKLDIGANLHLFGPETGGFINVNWSIISFNIKIGNPEKSKFIYILDWNSFTKTFLPIQPKAIIKINVNQNHLNQKISIHTQSLIPSNELIINDLTIENSSKTFGIRPMNKQQLQSKHSLKIINNKTGKAIDFNYQSTAKTQHFPAAIWSAKPLNTKNLTHEKVQAISGFDSLELIGQAVGNLAEAKVKYFESQSVKNLSKFESETQEIHSNIEKHQATIADISASINAQKTVENRTAIINELNTILAFSDSELLPNEALTKNAKNAERIYQSEPKIGKIMKGEIVFAKAKSEKIESPKSVEIRTEIKPTLLHFATGKNKNIQVFQPKAESGLSSRSIEATSIEEAVNIQLGSAFVFDLNENSSENKIKFKSDVSIQIIEFDIFNNLIQFQNLPKTATEFIASKKAKRVAVKGVFSENKSKNKSENKSEKYLSWKATETLPLVNANALLGDGFYLKMQVPMIEDERIAASVHELDNQNFIQTEKGIQKGFIDTLLFKDYSTIIVILNQKNSRKSDLATAEKAIELSIPFAFKNDFERTLNETPKLLKSSTALIDKNGNVRLKFRLSNRKLMKANKADKNWKGFALRLKLDENWQVNGLFLFEKRVKKSIWKKI